MSTVMANTDKLFPKLNDYQMQCAVEAGEEMHLHDGQVIFREGASRADFFVVLEGKIKVTRLGHGGEDVLAIHERGDFTGTTDLLTGGAATATGYALGPTRVARVPAEHFNDLILACPEMRNLLIPALTERRNAENAIVTQDQKLAALGKMSAGLAHELNNPAAAARRSAQTLTAALDEVEQLCCDLLNSILAKESKNGVALTEICDLARADANEIDSLTRSDREDELCAWLKGLNVSQPWDAAASLVSAGLTRQLLEPIAANTSPKLATKLLTWLAKDIEMRLTCRDLQESTGRITEIVGAMKSYTHMDQAQAKSPTDLNQGILATLTILKHKAKKKDLKWEKRFGDVPPVLAFGGELNQVWTNLLDNAIAAAPEGGLIQIHTEREGDQALVEITDNGPGIAPENQPRIFEPFFTTKGVGEGTGLGLDMTYRIVKNHRGDIGFHSRPGETRFTVRLPLS